MNPLHQLSLKKLQRKMAAIYATVYGIIFISVLPQIYLIYTSFLKHQVWYLLKVILQTVTR